MKIWMVSHDYRFAVEQTVMALLPSEAIETQISPLDENIPIQHENYLISRLKIENQRMIGSCQLKIQGNLFHGEVETEASPEEEIPKSQFAVKEAIYRAVVQTMDEPPPWGSLTGVRPVKLAKKIANKSGGFPQVGETFQKTYHVDPIRSQLAEDCAKVSVAVENCLPKDGISVYLGIPFCPSRCHYCSFFSTDIRGNQQTLADYLETLQIEIKETANLIKKQPITSLYLGGGTPTVLDASQLERLLAQVREFFPQQVEFTVEAGRPETISPDKLKIMKEFSVTRTSVNPQSMDDRDLLEMGRSHTVAEIHEAFSLCSADFQVNMDLIAGISPDIQRFITSVQEVVVLSPTQITLHSLTPKKNSALLENSSQLDTLAKEWKDAMNFAYETLEKNGYAPYYLYRQKQITNGLENVGWAKKNSQGESDFCLYNVAMMEEFHSIVGLGSGAMTKIVSKNGISRQQNPKFPRDYPRMLDEILRKKAELINQLF